MARLYTQTCSEKVDGVYVIEGIFGPGKDEMVEMIPGETAPKAGKSTLGGGKLWWRSGGARRRQGTARSHTFGIRCEVCQRARTCSLSVVRKGGGSWKAYSSTTSTNFYLLLLPAATTRLLLLLLLLHRARAQPGADSGFCCERCCHAISAVRSTRDDGSCRG